MDKCNLDNDNRQIEQLAYLFWEERGRPEGSPDEDWYRAERYIFRRAQSLSDLLNRSQLPFSSLKMGY
ncbi:MAG: DUF2934 domain-containing protein [Acidobacteria bacterium]|nr:DUF2934 domain-containing protein [Acidobacteriota bacterium]